MSKPIILNRDNRKKSSDKLLSPVEESRKVSQPVHLGSSNNYTIMVNGQPRRNSKSSNSLNKLNTAVSAAKPSTCNPIKYRNAKG